MKLRPAAALVSIALAGAAAGAASPADVVPCGVHPDAKIRKASQSHYLGNNVYLNMPPGTVVGQTVPSGTAARYDIKVQNDCDNNSGSITVDSNSPAGTKFINPSNGKDITAAIVNGKTYQNVPPLGHTPRIRLRVKFTAPHGFSTQVGISGSSGFFFDYVMADTVLS